MAKKRKVEAWFYLNDQDEVFKVEIREPYGRVTTIPVSNSRVVLVKKTIKELFRPTAWHEIRTRPIDQDTKHS